MVREIRYKAVLSVTKGVWRCVFSMSAASKAVGGPCTQGSPCKEILSRVWSLLKSMLFLQFGYH